MGGGKAYSTSTTFIDPLKPDKSNFVRIVVFDMLVSGSVVVMTSYPDFQLNLLIYDMYP